MQTVLYETSDGVALVTLNRPDRGNAWTGRMETDYRAAMAEAEADDDVSVIVLTGAGRQFCVGADTKALDKISAAGEYDDGVRVPLAEPGQTLAPELSGRHSFLWGIPKPVIAAVNGAAAGVGMGLMAFCDLRFAAAGVKITTATARLGLPVEFGLSWILPRIVGLGRSAELLFASPVITAEEAERLGLVNKVFPRESLLEETLAYARTMARECAPSSLRAAKEQLYADLLRPFSAANDDALARMRAMSGTPDFNEGVAALLERRPPNFRPRSQAPTDG